MFRKTKALVLGFVLFGCSQPAEMPPIATVSTGGGGVTATVTNGAGGAGGSAAGGMTMASGSGVGVGGAGGAVAMIAPDFSLIDDNAASPKYLQPVSPRDYLKRVSGWYFGHST
ncbi:MAG: hypothetical protein EXR75_08755 [Myxococcales bacterium]|nr:hypothetical protein [Myxococcales bacterium]